MSTAERLRQAMERSDHYRTQKALAEALNVHPKTVAGWVNGRYTPKGHRYELRDLLGEDVMDDETPATPISTHNLSDVELLAHSMVYLTALHARFAQRDHSLSGTNNAGTEGKPLATPGRPDTQRTTVRSPYKRAGDPGAREERAR